MHEELLSLLSSTRRIFISAVPKCRRRYRIVVLTFTSLITSDAEHLFMCPWAINVSFLCVKCPLFCSFENWIYCLFPDYHVVEFLKYSGFLCQITCFTEILFHFVTYVFIFLVVSFTKPYFFLILIKSSVSIFSFMIYISVCVSYLSSFCLSQANRDFLLL